MTPFLGNGAHFNRLFPVCGPLKGLAAGRPPEWLGFVKERIDYMLLLILSLSLIYFSHFIQRMRKIL